MFTTLTPTPLAYKLLLRTNTPMPQMLRSFVPVTLASFKKQPAVTLTFYVNLAVCFFIVYSIGFHYYMAATEPPGGVITGLSSGLKERTQGPGSSAWWGHSRTRAAKASTAVVRRRTLVVEPATPISVLKANEKHMDRLIKKGDKGTGNGSSAELKRTSPSAGHSRSSSGHSHSSMPASSSSTGHMFVQDQTQMSNRHSHRHSSSVSSITSPRPPSSNGPNLVAPQPRPGAIRNLSFVSEAPSPPPRNSWESTSTMDRAVDPLDVDSDDLFPLAKMCAKCPKVPLYRALASLPPELRLVERALRGKRRVISDDEEDAGIEGTDGRLRMERLGIPGLDEDEEAVRGWLEGEADKMVPPPKPERAHHCSICKTCILKYVSTAEVLFAGRPLIHPFLSSRRTTTAHG